jgi:hypothetical protein
MLALVLLSSLLFLVFTNALAELSFSNQSGIKKYVELSPYLFIGIVGVTLFVIFVGLKD